LNEDDAKALCDKLSRYKYAFMTEEQIAKEKKREAMREMAEKLSYSALEKNILSSRFSRCHFGGPIALSEMEAEKEKIYQDVYWLRKLNDQQG